MRLDDAERLLGRPVAINANGGRLVTGKLIAVCPFPSITLEDEAGEQHHFCITAVDGWVVNGTPPRLGGEAVSGS